MIKRERLKDWKKTRKKLKMYAGGHVKRSWKYEKMFRKAMFVNGIHDYKAQKIVRHYIIDFYFPQRNLMLEVDGPYHKYNVEYDIQKTKDILSWGFNLLRIKHEQMDDDIKAQVAKIHNYPKGIEAYNKCNKAIRFLNQGYVIQTKHSFYAVHSQLQVQ